MTKQKQTSSRARTYARNRHKVSRKGNSLTTEPDSRYFLKLVLVLVLGTLWLKFSAPFKWMGITWTAVPVGVLVGLILIKLFESNQTDRKICYAVLLTTGVISAVAAAGIVI